MNPSVPEAGEMRPAAHDTPQAAAPPRRPPSLPSIALATPDDPQDWHALRAQLDATSRMLEVLLKRFRR